MAKVVEAASALASIQKHQHSRKNTAVYSRENILFRGITATMDRSSHRGSVDLGTTAVTKRHASGQVLPERGFSRAVTTASNIDIDELETIQPDCSFFGTEQPNELQPS